MGTCHSDHLDSWGWVRGFIVATVVRFHYLKSPWTIQTRNCTEYSRITNQTPPDRQKYERHQRE